MRWKVALALCSSSSSSKSIVVIGKGTGAGSSMVWNFCTRMAKPARSTMEDFVVRSNTQAAALPVVILEC